MPADKVFFDPQRGIERFGELRRAIVELDPDEGEELFDGDDSLVIEDIDRVLAVLAQAKAEGRKWYLEIEVDY